MSDVATSVTTSTPATEPATRNKIQTVFVRMFFMISIGFRFKTVCRFAENLIPPLGPYLIGKELSSQASINDGFVKLFAIVYLKMK